MSVPALVNKNIGVPLMQVYAVLFDLFYSNVVLEFSKHNEDGMFYMAKDGTTPAPPIQ